MRKMPVGAVKMIREIRAALATFFPSRAEHEMINNQLTAPGEEIGQRFPAVSGPSKTYSLSILTHGSSRRCRLTSSRNRVNSFSRVSKSLRATSHSASDTTLEGFISLDFLFDSIASIFILFSSSSVSLMISLVSKKEFLHGKRGEPAS